jgi:hypothetical protein
MALNQGDAYTSKSENLSYQRAFVGEVSKTSLTAIGFCKRCGMIEPGIAATPNIINKTSAVRILVS